MKQSIKDNLNETLTAIKIKYSTQISASVSMGWVAITIASLFVISILLNDFVKVAITACLRRRQKKKVNFHSKVQPIDSVYSPEAGNLERKKMLEEIRRLDAFIANAIRKQ